MHGAPPSPYAAVKLFILDKLLDGVAPNSSYHWTYWQIPLMTRVSEEGEQESGNGDSLSILPVTTQKQPQILRLRCASLGMTPEKEKQVLRRPFAALRVARDDSFLWLI